MTSTSVDRRFGINAGKAIKAPCDYATTANITLFGEQTIDGGTTADSRVLVRVQNAAAENGIWRSDSGEWTREPDFDESNDIAKGTLVYVANGTTLADTFWTVSNSGTVTVGTAAITWVRSNSTLSGVSAYWTSVLALTTAAASIAALGGVAKAGDTMTGDLTMSGASIVEAEGAAVASAATCNIWATDGNTVHITGTTGITSFGTAPQAGAWMKVIFDGALTLTQSANLNLNGGGSNVTVAADDMALVYADTTTQHDVFVIRKSGLAVVVSNTTTRVGVRQTLSSFSAMTSAGLPDTSGVSTGGTTITLTGITINVTAANGFDSNGQVDRIGQATAPAWTGLSTNGTMYLGVTVNSDGTLTTFSTTLAPTYQWGGTYSTTSNQRTYNIQEAVMKSGNGSSAVQAYDVFIGQVTVSGGVVTALTIYAPNRRYIGGYTATLPGANTLVTANHNLGFMVGVECKFEAECTTAELGFAVGETADNFGVTNGTFVFPPTLARTATVVTIDSGGGFTLQSRATHNTASVTVADWKYRFTSCVNW
jgi:uncharacterized cupin superfamily protein